MKITRFQFSLLIMSFVIILLMCVMEIDPLLITIVGIFCILFVLCFKNINTNIYFFCFLISFFVFLVSGDLADAIFGKKYWLQFSDDANYHAHLCILISVVFLLLGYAMGKKKKQIVEYYTTPNDSITLQIRSWSRVLFYVGFVFLFIDTLYKVFFVMKNGYYSYYTDYSSVLGIFAQIGDICPIALCSFLATFPTKRECRWPIRCFAIYAIAGFLVGQRGALIYNMVFIIGYMFYRNTHDENHEIWIKKGWILTICLMAPIAIVLLQFYGYIREGQAIQFTSIKSSIVDFFVSIGASSKVIKAGYDYSDQLTQFKFYSLGDTLNYLKYSKLFHWFSSSPSVHSAEYALNGHSFDAMISYLYMRSQFLAGHGAGSSFIACLFTDFGYVGVAFGSFLYGLLFKSISFLDSSHWLSSTMKLYALLFLMKAPRGSYDGFIGAMLNVTFIVIILCIYSMAVIFNKKRVRKNEVKQNY